MLVVLDMLAVGLFWLLETRKETELSAASAPAATSGLLAWFAPEHAPALAYILLGLAIVCLIFSFFTFVFDVWRIPLFVPLLLYLWWCGMSATDHIFPVFAVAPATSSPAPARVLTGHDKAIVVAAAGGGVQAAGWTAAVLSGLAQEYPNLEFARSVRLISGVSGGAVGTMYYVRAHERALAEPQREGEFFQGARDASVLPSLDVVAWGMVTKDFRVALFPTLRDPEKDRAWAFEQALAQRAQLKNTRLSAWGTGIAGGLPAVIMNAVEVETGHPVVFSTSTFTPAQQGFTWFTQAADVNIVTAARISASFPFVLPVARPDQVDLGWHLADGGYYDNYGLVSLMAWVRQATQHACPLPRLLLLQIVAFPADGNDPPKPRGWTYQGRAPLEGMLSMRTAAQGMRNNVELELLARGFPWK